MIFQPTSIYSGKTTVIPVEIPPAPTMKISVPTAAGQVTAAPPPSTATPTAPGNLSAPSDPISVDDLALPFDPDEIAAILKANPGIHFRYKHRAFVFPNCSTLTHLGEIMELYSAFTEGNPAAPPAPSFKVYAPTDLRILKVWGTSRYRLMVDSRIGINENNKPFYLSFLTLTRLGEPLAQKMADLLQIPVKDLKLESGDAQSAVGPYLFTQEYASDADDIRVPETAVKSASDSVLIRKGELIGYKDGPWEWYPTCDAEHTLSLHVFPTTNDAADHTQAVETFVPEITRHYLNLVVRELVIKRGITIDIQYRTRNVGHEHEFLAKELFERDVLNEISLSPWMSDIHPQRFTVSPASTPPVLIGEDE